MAPAAADQITAGYHELEIDAIESSGLNPRTHWNDTDDQELQASIRAEGVLEPIMVRPHPTKLERFQIVAGERRFRAAQAVGLGLMPAVVRDVTDEKLLELALTENIQRRNMHPLDEAHGFIKRLEMGKTTPEGLANVLGLSKRYVTDRIRLTKLSPKAAQLLEAGGMTVSHAIILAKLDPKLQDEAIRDLTDHLLDFDSAAAVDKRKPVLRSVADLREWVVDNVPVDPRSPEDQAEFPQLQEAATEAAAKGATVVVLSVQRTPWQHKAKLGDPLFADKWQECKKTDKAAQIGVIVEGRRRGERVYFKPVAPPKPASTSSTSSTSPATTSAAEQKKRDERIKRERAAEAKRKDDAKRWTSLKKDAIAAVADHVAKMPLKALIAIEAKAEGLKPLDSAEAFLRSVSAKNATVSDYSVDTLQYGAKRYGFDVKKWFAQRVANDKKAAKAIHALHPKKAKKR